MFEVPCAKPWPAKSHELRLGNIFDNIHQRCDHFDQIARNVDRLAAPGFGFPIVQNKWIQRVEPMLATFENLNGDRDVPLDFVVPPEAPWKKMDWGIQLVRTDKAIRHNKAHSSYMYYQSSMVCF